MTTASLRMAPALLAAAGLLAACRAATPAVDPAPAPPSVAASGTNGTTGTPTATATPAATPPAPVQVPRAANLMHAWQLAVQASGTRDYGRAIAYLRQAAELAPGHPLVLHGLARMHARAGQPDSAVAALERILPQGLATDVRADTTFGALRTTPRFLRVAALLADSAAPLVRSDTAVVLPDPDLIPESVARDAADGALYVGSFGQRRIVRVGADGRTRDLVPAGRDGLGLVLGVRVRPRTRWLYAVNWLPDSTAPRSMTGARGRAQLHVYTLPDGRLVKRVALRDTAAHMLNDVAFVGGDAYLTDSFGGAVWRLRSAGDSLELLHRGDARFVYPNGIAPSADGRAIYAAHVEGIRRIGLHDGTVRDVAVAPGVWAGGVDGMYACGEGLLAVQAAGDHDRVVRFALDSTGTRITASRVLERRHPAAQLPTTGVVAGDTLLYIVNSQIRRVRESDWTITPSPSPTPSVLLRLPLGGACRD